MAKENKQEEVKEEPKQEEPKPTEQITDEDAAIVERIEQAADRMELASLRAQEVLLDKKEADAKEALKGETEAGIKEEPKEETPKEYKDRVLKGEI